MGTNSNRRAKNRKVKIATVRPENAGRGQNSPLAVPLRVGRQVIDCFVLDMPIPQEGAGQSYCMAGRVTGTGAAEDISEEAGDFPVPSGPGGVRARATTIKAAD